MQKRFSTHHVWREKSKPGCRIVGSVTSDLVTTVANSQESHQSSFKSDSTVSIQRGCRDTRHWSTVPNKMQINHRIWALKKWVFIYITLHCYSTTSAPTLSSGFFKTRKYFSSCKTTKKCQKDNKVNTKYQTQHGRIARCCHMAM